MPSMVLSGNGYFIQAFSYIGSFACNLVVITLSVLPFIIFLIYKKNHCFLICLYQLPAYFFSFLRYNNKTQTYSNQLVTIVQPNIKQKKSGILIKEFTFKKINKLSIIVITNKII